jgi:VanZ family protein
MSDRDAQHVHWRFLALAYLALLIYASLFPFSGWTTPAKPFEFLAPAWPHHWRRVDMLINVLAYVPLGLLLARWWRPSARFAPMICATLAGAALSFGIESLQQFLPSRVASLTDVLTNTLGTLAGIVLASFVRSDSLAGTALAQWRERWFRPGRLADLGLIAIGIWTLSQLVPFVPSLDIGELRHGLSPLWATLRHPSRFDFNQWAAYTANIAGLALLARTLAKPVRPIGLLFFGFVACVLLLKVPVMMRQLSLEAVAGAIAAGILTPLMLGMRMKAIARAGAFFVLVGFAVTELAKGRTVVSYPFAWIPFTAQMENPLIGIASILENIWPAAALAYLIRFASPFDRHRRVAWSSGLALGTLAFGLEWAQQFIPGRIGDITTVLLMTGTWALFWMIPLSESTIRGEQPGAALQPRAQQRSRTWILAGTLILAAGALVLAQRPTETRVDETKLPQLPAPAELPPVALPSFRVLHPRLPSPTTSELTTLRALNADFLRQVRNRADGGKGDIYSAALQELIEPGSVDMNLLYRRLMALKFTWRGHEQGKPLALAYDWLYPLWTEMQRSQLRNKLVDGCDYLINLIRKDRLSPYNVILYNAPFQALMACSIAIYRDDPRGDAIMAFTYDLWKNRLLPSWRQVMGRHGGWHEGGEYVGIGIGQAIYELPSMWRRATGEDLFASEPGIRGFLDFLVYRTRPDGTHFRWGDGAWFDRIVPDAIPLALEFRDAAAYSLRPPRRAPVPSAWPWGPLTDATLDDPAASARLPLARLFDGIGMLVARSDWSPQATYVTFEAGDNFWSHSHLDQGAFTIYKGGALAIDSGLYGPQYGSDHHMNYDYQTIAHNTITVTDPQDTVPAPGKEGKTRPIANDGGQRRIGSGWGVEAAPLDRTEWEAKRDIYHTASMESLVDRDGLTVAVADITPAYTNRRSGTGTFSARTRRVERFWRTFGYDRVEDVVVVFDQVTSTKPSFRKRWLLHTIESPQVTADGFSVSVLPQNRPGHAGGRLEARVLLPKRALIDAIGGRGFEFFVDGKNYDENGKLEATIKKLGPNRGEPGAWRVEVSPPRDEPTDLFLVVLLPTALGAHPTHRVRLLESGNRVGCEITGPKRTTRWWFEPGHNQTDIEVTTGSEQHRYHVEGPMAPAPTPPGWLERLRRSITPGR